MKKLSITALVAIFYSAGALVSLAATYDISGHVGKPGVSGATIFLCDAKSGLPLEQTTHQKISATNSADFLCASSDPAGRFVFTNIPSGSYRLVAQKFQQSEQTKKRQRYVSAVPPSEGLELLGTAEHLQVPSSSATNILILPLGKGVLAFDQKFPNDGGYLLISTRKISGDPILGFLGWNEAFLSHLIGVGCNPSGGTLRVSGLPGTNIQTVIFANDNSPGFGAAFYEKLPATLQKVPIVAGWSDAQHEPPSNIRHIMDVLETNKRSAGELLKIRQPRSNNMIEQLQELARSLGPLDRSIDLPNGEKATVADVFACIGYKALLDSDRERKRQE